MNTKFNFLMKNKIKFLTILLPIFLNACGILTVGSGNIVTEIRDVRNFDRVSFEGTGELLLMQGIEESLSIEADDNMMEYIESEVRGGTLYIGLQENEWGEQFLPSRPVRFLLTMTELTSLNVSGVASADTGDIVTDRLEVHVSGVSNLSMGRLLDFCLQTLT